MAIERKMVRKGDFLTSGPPADLMTKVFVTETVEALEAVDQKFDDAERLQATLEQTRKALRALKSKPVN